MIRIILPYHLRNLAKVSGEVHLTVKGEPTIGSVLDALEMNYPMLRGTIRDHVTGARRPMLRFFACQEDLSHHGPATVLPAPIVEGKEPFVVLGAIAGG